MKNMENLKKLKEKEFAEKADRSKNTISLLRKLAFVLAVIVAALMLFYAQKDYNNYAGSQLVMAEVINVEGIDDKNINVAYRYVTLIMTGIKKHSKILHSTITVK